MQDHSQDHSMQRTHPLLFCVQPVGIHQWSSEWHSRLRRQVVSRWTQRFDLRPRSFCILDQFKFFHENLAVASLPATSHAVQAQSQKSSCNSTTSLVEQVVQHPKYQRPASLSKQSSGERSNTSHRVQSRPNWASPKGTMNQTPIDNNQIGGRHE